MRAVLSAGEKHSLTGKRIERLTAFRAPAYDALLSHPRSVWSHREQGMSEDYTAALRLHSPMKDQLYFLQALIGIPLDLFSPHLNAYQGGRGHDDARALITQIT